MSRRTVVAVSLVIALSVMLVILRDDLELRMSGAHSFVVYSDKDNIFSRLQFAVSRISSEEYRDLQMRLLSANNKDLLSKFACIEYIYHTGDTAFLDELIKVRTDFERIGQDSVLLFQVASGRYRGGCLSDDASVVVSLRKTIAHFEDIRLKRQ